jgi:NADPH2:quinone reductase
MTVVPMRAAIAYETNQPFTIGLIGRPIAGPGEVLVRIHASGVNPLDTKIHAGLAAHAHQPLPAVLGLDLAGTVVVIGEGVTRFAPGDEVYGMAGGVGGLQGTLAEYIAVDADLLARKPSRLSMREAAALPLVAITAWEGLVDRMAVADGQTLLVQGGAGGVGHVAIQLGQALGARVFATGSPVSRAVIEQLGATFIDRFAPIVEAVERHGDGRGFDRVFDTVGGEALDASFAAVRRFGHVASALGWGSHKLAPLSFKGATYSGVFTLAPLLDGEGRRHHGEILEGVAGLVDEGRIRPILADQHFDLSEIDRAYALIRAGGSPGKLVVEL